MTIIVINEHAFTDAPVQNEGISKGYVFNGDWRIVVDWSNKLCWAEKYPERKTKIKSVRLAVKGECLPYY